MSPLPPCAAQCFESGAEVGAERWPLSGAHPDAWGRPWKGVVLSPTAPRALRETLAFPRGEPAPAAIRALFAKNPHLGTKYLPVSWEFGKVYWERADELRPFVEDLAAWEAARAAALARAAEGRLRSTRATVRARAA